MARARDVDPCRVLVLLDCAVELAVFLAFFLVYALPRGSMISETLFALPVYSAVLTAFLLFRLMFGVLFLYGHRMVRAPEGCESYLTHSKGIVWSGFLLALAGWVWLCWHRDDPNHLAGVAVFAAGSLAYSLALIQVARLTERHRWLDRLHTALEYAVLGVALSLAVAFAVMWWQGIQQTFIVEHAAYVASVGFWMTFFSFHWLEPRKQEGEPYGEVFEMGPVPQCQPLLPVWVQGQPP